MKDKVAVLGDAKDRNDSIYSNNDDYQWDVSSKTSKHRWRRVKGHNGAKAIGIAELKKRGRKYEDKVCRMGLSK